MDPSSTSHPDPAPGCEAVAPAAHASVPGPAGITGKILSIEKSGLLLQHVPLDRIDATQRLGDVLYTLQQLWFTGSDDVDVLAQKLGDASRNVSWRLPLGDAGVLNFFLDMLSLNPVHHPLKLHALRVVGNACADTDENRARVVESGRLPSLVTQLADDVVLPFVVQVLHNIIVDYEPAQLAASQAGLSPHLVDLLSSPRLIGCYSLISTIGTILELLVAQQPEPMVASPQTPSVLLNLAVDSSVVDDPADTVLLISVALSYLSFENLQSTFVASGGVPTILSAFQRFTTLLDSAAAAVAQGDDAKNDLGSQFRQAGSTFMQLLADICYLPSFTSTHPLGSPVFETLTSWLDPSSHPSLQAAACLCIGNLARSDETSIALVQTHATHLPVIAIVASQLQSLPQPPPDPLLLHSSLSLLKNLAIPPATKPLLSSLLSPQLLPSLWSLDPNTSLQIPQLQFASASLARLLLTSSPPNVRLFISPDQGTKGEDETPLHRLLDLFTKADPTSAAHTRTEAARALLAILKALHTTPTGDQQSDNNNNNDNDDDDADDAEPLPSSLRADFYARYANESLLPILAFLVTQDKFPALRSEAWFVMALMARSLDGAAAVTRLLKSSEGAWDALRNRVRGRQDHVASTADDRTGEASSSLFPAEGTVTIDASSSAEGLPAQQQRKKDGGDVTRADRENALVLVSELMRIGGDALPAGWKAKLDETLKQGEELVVGERGGI
ncbi:ARM repeat-containing protein [Sodiomyces alkalinus F11]|uniref:ARM repeat-containing protein n=1 Tax=Sodiomyces alkalinus (strain CBS 110278 / VKM F-3762 / F11) TaxID=1314773 RepID=A0A3N2Q7E9_SODAK|nr:ARM repeat-containing protein [Sodiomyces alkalinus F11]ROT42636.1 ARM repeat-containing protein [Sodiomyces alkalinus F11]